MRPPQQGQGQASAFAGAGSVVPGSSVWTAAAATASNSRARAMISARAVGQEPVVADAVEALGQDVEEEAADELVRRERHRLVLIAALEPVVLPLKVTPCASAAIRRLLAIATQ
jgi:hypothetical protein